MSAAFVANLFPKPTPGQTDERLAVSDTALGFTTNWKTNTLNRFVVLDIQTNDVMCTFDGSDPTATNGHRLYAGQSYTWAVDAAAKAKFIRQSADAVIHASGFTY
jgi:hypothetical protein